MRDSFADTMAEMDLSGMGMGRTAPNAHDDALIDSETLQRLMIEDPERAEILLDKQLCLSSFREYVELAWPILEPGTQFKSNWHIDLICEYLTAVTDGEINRIVFNMPPRYGKLVSDNELVPTPSGWSRHGDLKAGDLVFGQDGKPCRILAVSEPAVANMELVLQDGSVFTVHENHEWTVFCRNENRWRTYETKKLARLKLISGAKPRCTYQVPDRGAIEMPDRKLPVPPYTMGAWLGDGSRGKGVITHHIDDTEVIGRIVQDGFDEGTSWPVNDGTTEATSFRNLSKALRESGVFYQKRIPQEYLRSSVSQRLELVAGLVDTDGHVDTDDRVTIVNTEPGLVEDIKELITSLGWRISEHIEPACLSSSGIQGKKDVHYIRFTPDREIPTQIPRKLILGKPGCQRRIGIIAVRTASRPEVGRCIQVDRHDGLYRVGRGMHSTHNSILITVLWPTWEWLKFPHYRYLFTSYSASLSTKHSVDRRQVMQSAWYRKRFGRMFWLTTDQNIKTEYSNNYRGVMVSTSTGGTATGKGGQRVVIDDPQNPQQAESDTERLSTIRFFDQTLSSRLDSKTAGAFLLVMQRLHQMDLTARCLELGYHHVKIPAVAQERTIVHFPKSGRDMVRPQGDILWPEREGPDEMRKARLQLTPYGFCTPQESPVLMEDLSLKPIGQVKEGDRVIGFTTDTKPIRENEVCSRRHLIPTEVKAISRSVQKVVKVTLDSGKVIRCTANHNWYTGGKNGATGKKHLYQPAKVGRKLYRVCGDKITSLDDPDDIRAAGWLAGFFDGEGSAVLGHGGRSCLISFTQNSESNIALCEKLETELHRFGFDYGCFHKNSSDPKLKNVRMYYLRGQCMEMYQKFLHVIQPLKWRDRIASGALGAKFVSGTERVVSIEEDGEEEVFGLTTGTGNYVVWGLASSNSSQYQQDPIPVGGQIFDVARIGLVKIPPAGGFRVRYWDKAGTEGGGAYTCGILMSRTKDGRICVEDVIRGQWSPSVRESIIKQTTQQDMMRFPKRYRVYIEQEPGSAGKESAELTIRRLQGAIVKADKPSGKTGNKVTRARPFASQVGGGNVTMVEAPWNKEFIEELRYFPNSMYKDQVDAAAGAYNKLAKSRSSNTYEAA